MPQPLLPFHDFVAIWYIAMLFFMLSIGLYDFFDASVHFVRTTCNMFDPISQMFSSPENIARRIYIFTCLRKQNMISTSLGNLRWTVPHCMRSNAYLNLFTTPWSVQMGSLCRATCLKPLPHAAMLHTCGWAFQKYYNASKSYAMCSIKVFNILLPILE